MGALKRIYMTRFNLDKENVCLYSMSTLNRPVSFWNGEKDGENVIKEAFKKASAIEKAHQGSYCTQSDF